MGDFRLGIQSGIVNEYYIVFVEYYLRFLPQLISELFILYEHVFDM